MFDDFDVDYPENTGFNEEFDMSDVPNDYVLEETVTISKKYLQDLVQEMREDYEAFIPVDSMKSLALRTLYYLAND